MRVISFFYFLSLLMLFTSCANRDNKVKNLCILDFMYEKNEAVGPEGLVSIIQVDDKELRKILLSSKRLVFKYYGGIYEIDSLYFPPPINNIFEKKDSTIVFGQGVYGLRQYPEVFIDSVIQITKRELIIEVIDTLNNKKWTIANCK